MVREQADFKLRSRSFERASEPGPSTATVSPKQIPIRRFFSFPNKGEGNYMSTKLYVGNLAFQTTSEELQQLFAQAGTVESASVVEDRMTGRSRGFAFVEMSTKEEASAAIDQFNGKEVGGRALKVNEAKPRENRNGGGGRGGFGGNRGGYGNRGGGGGGRGGNSYGGSREPRW
jgi:RNA recognition motif-containing protein